MPKKKPNARPEPEHAWDQRIDEGDVAYQTFLKYRDQAGKRSIQRLAENEKKHVSLLNNWSSAHDWPARAAAWDKAERERLDAERADAQRRLLEAEQADGDRLLSKWNDLMRQTPLHLTEQTLTIDQDGKPRQIQTAALNVAEWRDLVRMRREVGDLLRRAVGLPEKVTQSQMTGKDGGAVAVSLSWADLLAQAANGASEADDGELTDEAPDGE